MAKIKSNWIDNPAYRKELYNFNQAVKSIFTMYRYLDGIVLPMTLDNVKTTPLFDRSFFIRNNATHWDFMNNSIVNPEELNKALKEKCYIHKVINDTHILTDDTNDHEVGRSLDKFAIEDSKHHPGLKRFHLLKEIEPLGSYKLNDYDCDKLVNYDLIDRIIAIDNDHKVRATLSKQIFPMIKKSDITILTYPKIEGIDELIYEMVIVSKTEPWSFYSIHHILQY